MSNELLAHSERTWLFAHALALANPDDAPRDSSGDLDDVAMYAACLLHDAGLFGTDRDKCFATVGANLAQDTASAAGIDSTRSGMVASAIAGHVDASPKTPFARLLRDASMVDVVGFLTWKIDPAVLTRVCRDQPRTGFPAEVERLWIREVDKFPYGRAAFAKRPGCMLTLARLNPLDRIRSEP